MAMETRFESQASSKPVRPAPNQAARFSSRLWPRVGVVAVLAAGLAAVLLATMKASDSSPQLTYTITRGDLLVTVTEQGILESSENTEIKCKVRGRNAVLWIIESGSFVEAGDELVRLDALFIQEQIDERTKYAHWSQSAADQSAATLATAILAVSEYEQGRYISELLRMEKDLVVAEAKLRTAENELAHAQVMEKSEYVSELTVEEKEFGVNQGKLDVDRKKTQLDVGERFTKQEQSQTLLGNLNAIRATHEANVERAMADASRRDRALEEIQYCVVKAERSGLVIHPNAAKWESRPVAEGTSVHKDQVLLLMPDLEKMQVKVGFHESVIDRISEGLPAKVTLPDVTVEGQVASVASVAKPAGWWTGNAVTYDTLIGLPSSPSLRPGMSAEVEVTIARYDDVLTIPVAAVVESAEGPTCLVRTADDAQRRKLVLGDSNTIFTVVESGLQAGEQVVLNPTAIRD